MKSTAIKFGDRPPKNYPCLKSYTSGKGTLIVLFTSFKTGMVVGHLAGTEPGRPIGDYFEGSWAEKDFEDFDGAIILES